MMNAPYRERLTRMLEVRTVSGWTLKTYSICGAGSVVDPRTVDAAVEFAARHVDWPRDAEAKFGFLTVHAGEEAVWLLVDLWVEDILRHFVFRAPCNSPEDFGPGPCDGTMACVWELAVVMFERASWIKHVLASCGQPNYSAYLRDGLEIDP